MPKIKLSKNFINNVCKLALNEDLYPTGDITSNLLKNNTKIKLLIGKGNFTYEGGYEVAEELLQNKYLTAIFCADDTMAFGCVDFIKNKTKLKSVQSFLFRKKG